MECAWYIIPSYRLTSAGNCFRNNFFFEVYRFCAGVSGVSPSRFRVPRKERVEFFELVSAVLQIARKEVIRPFVLNFSACICCRRSVHIFSFC